MAATKYQKAISTHFTGLLSLYTKPNEDTFKVEIGNSSIVTALDKIEVVEASDQVDIWFKDALSSGDQTTLTNLCAAHDGTGTAEELETPDHRKIVAPSVFREDVTPQFVGEGDDVTNGNRYGGTSFEAEKTDAGSADPVIWQFIDPISIAGGRLIYKNAVKGDEVTFDVIAPATAGTSNEGAGDYDKYALGGGANMFIPNGESTGDWDLNLTETLNANVDFTKVVPVPASDNDGWFDWNSVTGAVTFNSDQTGGYNLFDFDVTIARFVAAVKMLGDGDEPFNVPAYNSKGILPHWKYKVTITRADTGTLTCVWNLFVARKDTTP